MKIYALVWGELVLYVGKTNTSLKQRAASHRTPSNIAHSKYIPDYMDWEIVLVDEVPDEEGTKWEKYYYDELMPLYNRCRPGQTRDEYHRTIGFAAQKAYLKEYQKTEKHKEYQRAYRQANRERLNQLQRNWRASR
jgi:hypothetical protein